MLADRYDFYVGQCILVAVRNVRNACRAAVQLDKHYTERHREVSIVIVDKTTHKAGNNKRMTVKTRKIKLRYYQNRRKSAKKEKAQTSI